MIQQKAWGALEVLLQEPRLIIARATTKAGGYSSWHRHNGMHNAFIVQSGAILIEQSGAPLLLQDGNHLSVPARASHRFSCFKDSTMLEIYTPAEGVAEISIDDIERFSEGGLLSLPDIDPPLLTQ